MPDAIIQTHDLTIDIVSPEGHLSGADTSFSRGFFQGEMVFA